MLKLSGILIFILLGACKGNPNLMNIAFLPRKNIYYTLGTRSKKNSIGGFGASPIKIAPNSIYRGGQ
jgi:hypothetical protein